MISKLIIAVQTIALAASFAWAQSVNSLQPQLESTTVKQSVPETQSYYKDEGETYTWTAPDGKLWKSDVDEGYTARLDITVQFWPK